MRSNFEFLTKIVSFNNFSNACVEAEKSLVVSPSTCAITTRRALELAVKWVYQVDNDLKIPYRENLSSLIHDRNFLGIIDEKLLPMMKYIVKLGNTAVHTNSSITRDEAILSVHHLYQLISWIDYCYSDNYTASVFNESILPEVLNKRENHEELQDLYERLSSKDRSISEARKDVIERDRLTSKRVENTQQSVFYVDMPNEAYTRKAYIDIDLKLAGWKFGQDIEEEYPVKGMPNLSQEGFVDYVLRGENGKIIGLIEAKRTSVDPNAGKQQARLYADYIEKEQGLRPVIFYTNGFVTNILHDQYPARKTSGYYNKKDLQRLIDRRELKRPLNSIEINEDITNRVYQKKAVISVCDAFSRNQRKTLLVMATGSGKTRTAMSIVDVLTKNNWIKNVLFLADRTSLIKQAMRNFNKLMPNLSLCNLLEKNADPEESRMVFSTYPTMMNAIDVTKNKNGNRLFTVGHFDLIIIDESHRSIYQKYRSIFDYFDSMLIGLTATPKDEVDKNTYSIFNLENGLPTFAYELKEAVDEGYLVDYVTVETKTKFLEKGISYDDLSKEEKEIFEDAFEDEPNVRDIDSSALNQWLFNANTIDMVLEELMLKGVKIEGGDKLGKTILFAKNHRHALAIKERFDKKFPELGPHFAEIIDYSVNYYQSLIDDFSVSSKRPQIAISVDMLDTGIDVPEVVNLVFFKKIRSKTKFWQMIGRGTRTCEDLLGLGQHKNHFKIFDWCANFEYFRANAHGEESKIAKSLTEKLFNIKVDIIRELQDIEYQSIPSKELRENILQGLIKDVQVLNEDNFRVRQHIKYVHKFRELDEWATLSVIQTNEIKEHIAPLIQSYSEDELAKRFDILMFTIELAKLDSNNATKPIKRVITTAKSLSKLGTIPQVLEQQEVIKKVQNEAFWQEADISDIEEVREVLRDLIKFIERSQQKIYYTDFQDEVIDYQENGSILDVNNLQNYRQKVEYYLKKHQDHLVVYKLRHNKKISGQDVKTLEKLLWNELGTKEQYKKDYGDTSITRLVRNIVGLERQPIMTEFSEFLSENRLNMNQIHFVELIIDYVVKNGTLDKRVLQEDPFRNLGSVTSLFKENKNDAKAILDIVDGINNNAEFIS